jgi:RpiR family transcriptional regulator, carbohydrate utilization regulator
MSSPDKTPAEMDLNLGKPQGVRARVRAYLPALHAAEKRVATLVVEQPHLVIYKSASEVGELVQTSAATVVRTAQRMGFNGFHDLKLSLANELAVFERPPLIEPTEGVDSRIAVLATITKAGAESVRDASALVLPEVFEAAVEAISQARRVLFFGVGTSAPLCQDAAYRFSAIGVLAEAPMDAHVQHVQARLMSPSDVCVIVSHTGSTRETVTAAKAARAGGATAVAITSFAMSPLTETVDHVIVAGTRELALRFEAMASRLAHMAVIDALLVAVAERDPERARRALDIYTDVLGEHRY